MSIYLTIVKWTLKCGKYTEHLLCSLCVFMLFPAERFL